MHGFLCRFWLTQKKIREESQGHPWIICTHGRNLGFNNYTSVYDFNFRKPFFSAAELERFPRACRPRLHARAMAELQTSGLASCVASRCSSRASPQVIWWIVQFRHGLQAESASRRPQVCGCSPPPVWRQASGWHLALFVCIKYLAS